MRILFISDIMGRPGRKCLAEGLPVLRKRHGEQDFLIANGENAAAGRGLTQKILEELFSLGVDGVTSGNHIWDKSEFVSHLSESARVIRPANYPEACPGQGVMKLEKNGKTLVVINLQGRVFLPPLDCPFRVADDLLRTIDDRCILVDFHAEATSEKRALGLYLDGRVSAVLGTHTHVQTADEEVLPGGTAYISDAGMTGGHGGVIGMKAECVLPRFLTGMPSRFEVSEENVRVEGVLLEIDDESGRACAIERIRFASGEQAENDAGSA